MSETIEAPKKKVNPFVNLFMRLVGEWPISGPPPLSQSQYEQLFDTFPAFVDYFPIIDYDDKEQVYLLDDYINVAAVYEVHTRYMAAKTEDALDDFNNAIALALNALPSDDRKPYIVQIFANKQGAENMGVVLENSIDPELKKDSLTQAVIEMTKQHADLLTHRKGIFRDKRLPGNFGWRVGQQKVYMVIYRKQNEAEWKNAKKTPTAQLKHDMTSFATSLTTAGVHISPVKPHELVNWLAPFFGNDINLTETEFDEERQVANFDLGQKIFSEQPHYHQGDANERGIWRFGNRWSRHLTIGGINRTPRSGEITIGQQYSDGSSNVLGASVFERLPTGSIFTYTIIPQSDANMKFEIGLVHNLSADAASREAQYANEQIESAYEEIMRNHQKIFYAQMGIFISAESLDQLLDYTELTAAEIKATNVLQVIEPKYDLLSQDTYIKALPCVYDFRHDRNAALRARKCYTSHLSSLLPFFGNKSGGVNPCYIMYTRSGEPFYINPFHADDKERVSHELFFGPSGSGKSATVFYMTLMSMAVNNPRTFVFDYGNSFKLLADFAESHGKKVKRVKFTSNSSDVIAPFFETQKALVEVKISRQINDGSYVPPETTENDNTEEDEERSYLGEMEAILRVMLTGGSRLQDEKLTMSQKSYLYEALIRGLELSVEQGESHARPSHIVEAMKAMADYEMQRKGGMSEIALTMNDMAASLKLWTMGERGMLFNRSASGFSTEYDLTIVEIGNLAKSLDMLAVAGLASIYNITAMAEKLQNSGRSIEVKIDELHNWAKIPMLMDGLLVGAKVFRKLNTWLSLITQDVSDFDEDSSRILTNAEFWWLMKMPDSEIEQITKALNLDDEVKHLITFPTKESGCFVEGVSISAKFPDTLIRYIQPSLVLALAQTDGKEKEHRHKMMEEHRCSELEAAYLIAEEIDAKRREFQQQAA